MTDSKQKFDLSLRLDDLDAAVETTRFAPDMKAEAQRKAIGDLSLAAWRINLAQKNFAKAGELSALMFREHSSPCGRQ